MAVLPDQEDEKDRLFVRLLRQAWIMKHQANKTDVMIRSSNLKAGMTTAQFFLPKRIKSV
jgi:hypothetical protein